MIFVSRLVRMLCLLALVLAAAPVAGGDDATCSEAELKSRKSKLRPRAAEWWRTRKRLVYICPQCKGQGKIRSGRRRIIDCPKCDGHRKVVERKRYKKLFFDMRSPAFRSRPGIHDRLNAEFQSARQGAPWPQDIDRYHIDGVEMVGATHGVVHVEVNREDVTKAQRWVWAEDERGRHNWYLWDEAADGAWAQEPATATVGGRSPTPLAAPPELERLVVDALESSLLAFVPREVLVQGDTLLLRLLARPGADPEEAVALVGGDAVTLVRTLFPTLTAYAAMRADWYLNWRDDLGRTEIHPRWTSVLTRAKHDQAVWGNLSDAEQTKVLAWTNHTHDGWIPWAMSDPLPETVLPAPVLPGAEPTPQAAADMAWVDFLGRSFPPRRAYAHGVTLSANCAMTLDADARLCTARFDVPVYQEPEPIRSQPGTHEASVAALALFLPPNEAGKGLPPWVGIRLYVTHDADVAADVNVAGRAVAWANGLHVGGGKLDPAERVSADPEHEAFTVLCRADLTAALKLAKSRGTIVRFGSEAGLTVSLGKNELLVLQDLLSRVVPE